MNAAIGELQDRIAQTLFALAGEPFVRGHARVEMADDFGSVGVFIDRGDGRYHFSDDMGDSLYELFRQLRQGYIDAGLPPWSQATVTLEADGGFRIEFGYADIADLGKASERRQEWMRRVLDPQAQICWPAD